jgi:ArsR family transcriptional regulator, arsenate/arsenite/antimonite-responsive transcriptional repressor
VKANPVQFGKALADETRQRIMRYCCCDWRAVTDIAQHVGVTQPTASHHLAILREAELVHHRQEGKLAFYQLDQSKIVDCCGHLLRAFAPEEKTTAAVTSRRKR